MQFFLEIDSVNELYRIGEGGDGDRDDRIFGPIVHWGEVAELETDDGATLRALVTEDGEAIPVGNVTLEPDSEEWDLIEDYEDEQKDDGAADEPDPAT